MMFFMMSVSRVSRAPSPAAGEVTPFLVVLPPFFFPPAFGVWLWLSFSRGPTFFFSPCDTGADVVSRVPELTELGALQEENEGCRSTAGIFARS